MTMCGDVWKEAILLGEKERKCKQYVSWYNCQHILTESTQWVNQIASRSENRDGAKTNEPEWFLLAKVGLFVSASPRLRYPSGPSLSVLDSWSIVGSF